MLQIELDLKKYCIETAIKRSYNHLLSKYLRNKGGDTESEEKLALLQKALNHFDFSSLRTARRELAGKSSARIFLIDNGSSPPGISIDERPVDTEHCSRK